MLIDDQMPSGAESPYWRMFIAVAFPSEVKAECGKLIQRLKTGIQFSGAFPSWVKASSLHLTLAFLGNTSVDRISELQCFMEEATSGVRPLHLRLAGVTLFPTPKNPRVIALHLTGDLAGIEKIQTTLAQKLKRAGYPLDNRPFRPHVTLARIKSMRGLAGIRDVVHAHRDSVVSECLITGITLYRSHLLPDGPEYEPIVTANFCA
ncbi:MAG: RNA 2',3'-cyclic phosphodiesterase [Candidatus Sumerlaeaceae bacterium]|nr:RNA 2',3'-cyclic phosphodiesterase [Candidatus Sumerlaeaceae bacterium]